MPPILSGIIPPLVTPLDEPGNPDEAGLARLIERVVAGGVDALFLLGTTGETPSLTIDAKTRLVRAACGFCRSRVPVLVNLTATAAPEVFALAETAARCGAQAAVLAPPFYYPLSQDELSGYFERIIPRLPLPVYLYNYPQIFKVPIGIETLARVSALPQVLGMKDSSGDMQYFAAVRRRFPAGAGFGLYCGPDRRLSEALRLGAEGGVSGGANLFPRLYADLFGAHRRGDAAAVDALQLLVDEVVSNIHEFGHAGAIRAIKCALAALGVSSGVTAEPLGPLPGGVRARIAANARALEARLAGGAGGQA
ncbi:MAG: dihydrodipicolinate synthase family protein [Bryobacteraceae bacterium]